MRVQAALAAGPSAPLAIADVDLDDPRPDEVLVRLEASGVCHTDVYLSEVWPPGLWPMVFGHEGAGVVMGVGEDVTDVRVGDRVVVSFRHCGACRTCASGHPAYCHEFFALNMSGCRPDGTTTMRRHGRPVYGSFFGQSSFATHCLAHATNVVPIHTDIPFALAAPLACGFQTGAGTVLNALRPGRADSIAIFGAGGVGTAAVMAAAATDVGTIVVVEPVAERRHLAERLGATAVVDPTADDPTAAVREATGGGATHALDTTANTAVIRSALDALVPLGRMALVGAGHDTVSLNRDDLVGGKTVMGVIEGDATPREFIPRLLDLHAAGRFPIEGAISCYAFADIADAVAACKAGRGGKPVVLMGNDAGQIVHDRVLYSNL